jgi:hypothetical protein
LTFRVFFRTHDVWTMESAILALWAPLAAAGE